jgi:hypothetical protein
MSTHIKINLLLAALYASMGFEPFSLIYFAIAGLYMALAASSAH